MSPIFHDRSHAGKLLAERLSHYAQKKDVVVLALPHGGVPVGFEIAKALHLPLDIFLVRKLGVPRHPELAIGAIATGGIRVLNQEVIEQLGISNLTIDAIAADKLIELSRCESAYRGNDAWPVIKDKTIILVDDGIATGSTMYAAIQAIRLQKPTKIIVAIPAGARSSLRFLRHKVDDIICLVSPNGPFAVSQAYEQFPQLSDHDVRNLLSMEDVKPVAAS